ncbi:uncharacterized protein LOC122503689 [Leptopilina heterotoma]|uniref:uncharacterized protein LOC122503689 n=1 Tax=Leptopilina heterotoma TaxID=63436 RepID=UPI001CA8DC10|nr:uncharacterized protein LOC122503689 [Leptopilina heterotoma]
MMIYDYILISTLIASYTCMGQSNYYNLKCETIGMSWESGFNDGCSFVCKKRNNNYKVNNAPFFQKADTFREMKTDDGFFCSNNGSCLNGSCIKLNNTSIHRLLEAFHPIVSKNMQLNREKCQENGMSLAFEVSEGCIFVCEMKSDISNKRGYELKKIVYATDGSNCKTTGFCHEGMCINNNIKNPVTSSERCKEENLTFVENYSDECTTTCIDEFNDVEVEFFAENGYLCDNNNGLCHEGKCINTAKGPTIYKVTAPTQTSTSAPNIYKKFNLESPSERCENENMSFVENYSDECTTTCIDEFNDVEVKFFAENGYSCANNGLCHEGKCISEGEGPIVPIYRVTTPTLTKTTAITTTSTPTSTTIPTSTSTQSSTATSNSTNLKDHKSPSGRCEKENLTFVENYSDECTTAHA